MGERRQHGRRDETLVIDPLDESLRASVALCGYSFALCYPVAESDDLSSGWSTVHPPLQHEHLSATGHPPSGAPDPQGTFPASGTVSLHWELRPTKGVIGRISNRICATNKFDSIHGYQRWHGSIHAHEHEYRCMLYRMRFIHHREHILQ